MPKIARLCPVCGTTMFRWPSDVRIACSRACSNTYRAGPLEDRFWDHVPDRPVDGCWLWQGGTRMGYGMLRLNKVKVAAHRLSYEMHHGPIPPGLVVRHTCDTPGCVNPAHLLIGTTADNNRDRSERGRTTRQGAPKRLSDAQVDEIRGLLDERFPAHAIAAHFGVSQALISYIKHGKKRS